MNKKSFELNPNILVRHLKKSARDFTKEDIIRFITDNQIEMLNFRYVAGDGRLKTLNFVITGAEQLDTLLSTGERVDGSNIFSYIEAGSSDLYVVPKYKTAFVNPFAEIPTLEILCSYFDKDGNPLASSPENIMKKAHDALKKETGYTLDVMGELEYYVIWDKDEDTELFPTQEQRGYHESMPFTKWEELRTEAMNMIAQAGGLIKYGHSEVGNFADETHFYEQNEIEFQVTDIEDASDQLIIAKWILRMLGFKYGASVSFAPKITVGHAGSGLHIHMMLKKDGKSVMINSKNDLSDDARKAIAGILDIADALTAFGNTIPTSYLRLVPHQEAPTNICWGDRNRSVLIRVPLGWSGNASQMIRKANKNIEIDIPKNIERQTFEFRCPDGSADIHLLIAGLVTGVKHGLTMDNALQKAEDLYVDVNIFKPEFKEKLAKLSQLPASCWESADALLRHSEIFTKDSVFTEGILKGIHDELKKHDDKDLSERLYGKHDEIRALVESFLHFA